MLFYLIILIFFYFFFFFSSRRRHTRLQGDWSSDVCSSDLTSAGLAKYISKYVTKPEPKGLYHVRKQQNLIKEHLLARRLGSMEIMMLLLEIGRASCRERV